MGPTGTVGMFARYLAKADGVGVVLLELDVRMRD
jgi:hypothetical protein